MSTYVGIEKATLQGRFTYVAIEKATLQGCRLRSRGKIYITNDLSIKYQSAVRISINLHSAHQVPPSP
jgi:hypothetical protein